MILTTLRFYFTGKTLHSTLKFFARGTVVMCISTTAMAKEMIGWVENVGVYPGNIVIKAKIDTGADSSSINSKLSTLYNRNGEQWVKFSITDIHGNLATFDKKIVRNVKVKRNFGEKQQRAVVRMGICIGNQYGETNVSLIDRSNFNYNLLIGRNFLQGKFVIDPSLTFMAKPQCNAIDAK